MPINFKIGDKVLVRDKIKAKIRHDGQKLIVPTSEVANRYIYRAIITKPKGNCFDLEFKQDVKGLGIKFNE